ncbi:hypothetical protein BGAL_0049g00260 [Botrytis galanthina]|uniref:Ubiquitin-like domain-containing protein n=1 Tax=Botrytis galanthina TaxID=278940 RepID=A0A4S8R8D8_9HELO|nr:hypothetical protein BGAL_0049g00260 [Botrytis galanthina]
MSFGFSIGDFIAVGEVITTLIKGLRETAGSKSDYQELVRELQSLEKALKHVDNVGTSKGSMAGLDGVKCAALLCRYPLEEFLKKISKYKNALGPRAPRGIRSVGRKIQWAFTKKDEVQKLLGYLSIHTNSINMMLSTLGLEASDLANKRAEENHSSLKNLIDDTRIDILDTKISVTTIQDSCMNQSLLASTNQSMLISLSDIINGEVVLPLKSLGDMTTQNFTSTQQMLRMASEIRGMLPSVDTRFTYFQAPVKVEDALGRYFPMPSEYSFDDLRAIIHSRFKEGPGQYQVSSGNYEILNGKNRKQIISARCCERYGCYETGGCRERRGFSPGSTLTMAVILAGVRNHRDKFCPMPRCGSRISSPVIGGGRTCDECGIWFDSDDGSICRQLPNLNSSVFKAPIVNISSGSKTPLKTPNARSDYIDDQERQNLREVIFLLFLGV